ncbi:MAG: hypothetical protein BroJett011_33780 [Chloroflexota bacterium]|nr:MAG: hypothetical protein BroJett011_33780 [Chloroflexota bacterium]
MTKRHPSLLIEINLEHFNAIMRRVNDLLSHTWHEMIYKNQDQASWTALPMIEKITIGLLAEQSSSSHSTFLIFSPETSVRNTLTMYTYEVSKDRVRVELVDGWNSLTHEDTQLMGDDFVKALTELIIREVRIVEDKTQVDIQKETTELIGESGTKPWNKISDYRWDRSAVELWWTGHTYAEIASKVDKTITAKTVMNRVSLLRKQYGEEVVPTDKQLRKFGIKLRTSGY